MKKAILKLFTLPTSYKKVVFLSVIYSIWFEVCLRLNLYRFIKDLHANKEDSCQSESDDLDTLIIVRKSARALRKYAPWRPKCYNVALVAKRLLLNQNIESTIHIGFAKNNKNVMSGHAWITHCGRIIAGDLKTGLGKYTTLTAV